MSRRQNAEKFLNAELEACILGRRIPDWPDGKGPEYAKPDWDSPGNELGGQGSNNWAGIALGCRYSVSFRARRFDAQAAAARYFAISRTKFLGSEIDSSIYTWMVAAAVLEIGQRARERGDGANYKSALAWLRYLAARNLLYYDEGTECILQAGERSASHPPPHEMTWQDHYLRAVMGWGTPPRYEKVLNRRLPLLYDVGAPLRAGQSPADLILELGIKTIAPVRVVGWPKGKAVWLPGEAINGNTQAVKAAVWRDGSGVIWAPANRGYFGPKDRRHRKKGRSSIAEVAYQDGNRVLDYQSPIYARQVIPLPPTSARTLDLEIGGEVVLRDLRVARAASAASEPMAPEVRDAQAQRKGSALGRLGEALRRLFG